MSDRGPTKAPGVTPAAQAPGAPGVRGGTLPLGRVSVSQAAVPRPGDPDGLARLRRSVAVVHRDAEPTGLAWVALPGILATSLEAIGRKRSLGLVICGEGPIEASVVHEDTARGVVLLALAVEPKALSAEARGALGRGASAAPASAPSLGPGATVLAVTPGGNVQGVVLGEPRKGAAPWVAAVERGPFAGAPEPPPPLASLELAFPVPVPPGAPLVDGTGHVLGMVVTRAGAAIGGATLREAIAGGSSSSREAEQCPACHTPFAELDDRCRACGRLLPGAQAEGREPALHVLLRRVLDETKGALRAAGTTRDGVWLEHQAEGERVLVELDEPAARATGLMFRGALPVSTLPEREHERFFGALLSCNDELTSTGRLVVAGDVVWLVGHEPCDEGAGGRAVAVTRLVSELASRGAALRKLLVESFGVARPG
jgi:hypothetical protein